MNGAFAYVYDEFLGDKRFERALGIIEVELAERGIEGRIVRLAMFRDARKIIEELIAGGAQNIVFVGSDQTFLKMMAFLPDFEITVGYIPIIGPSELASVLRIPIGEKAVQVLAGRLIEVLDIGKVCDRYFLTELAFPDTTAAVEVDGKYRVSPSQRGAIGVRNLSTAQGHGKVLSDPQDGWLEVVIQSKIKNSEPHVWNKQELIETRLFLKQGTIVAQAPIEAFLDGQKVSAQRFPFSIIPKKLRFITGRPSHIAPR